MRVTNKYAMRATNKYAMRVTNKYATKKDGNNRFGLVTTADPLVERMKDDQPMHGSVLNQRNVVKGVSTVGGNKHD